MKITLCGSTRFKKEYQEANTRLSQAGHIVYTIAWAKEDESAATPGQAMDPITKETLDLVHLGKILNSDSILIVHDGSRYIGDSTRREILWAQMHGKGIFWYVEEILDYWNNPVRAANNAV
jgi:hypothetical protein